MSKTIIYMVYIFLTYNFGIIISFNKFILNKTVNEKENIGVSIDKIDNYIKLNDINNEINHSNNVRKTKQLNENNIVFEWMTERERELKSYNNKFINEKNDLKSYYNLICSSTINKINKRFWTHLIFIHADNNLESMSLVDLAEMTSPLHSNTAEYLHLVVYIDRCIDYTDKEISTPILSCPESGLTNPKIKQEDISQNFTGAYILYRWHLNDELRTKFRKKFVWIILDDLGEVDSNSPEVLSNFISMGLNMFPSIYTALTLWNHGSAWTGFGDDHDNADGVGMFLGDMYKGIKEGIANSNRGGNKGKNFSFEFKFDVLGFDACLMMQFDVLDSMSSLANYILASEDNEPGHGWNFRSINPVTKRGSLEDEVELFVNGKISEYRIATPLEYASRIIYGYSLHSQSYPLTLSLINIELFKIFKYNLYNLFTMLYACGGELIGDTIKKSILNSRKIENCDLVNLCSCFDMGDMLEQLRKYLSEEFTVDESIHELLALTLDSYYNMQVASVNLQEDNQDEVKSLESRLTGISIYFPDINQQVTCRISSTAKILSKKYIKQTITKWSNIINDIINNKPGQKCNLNLIVNSKDLSNEFLSINRTIINYDEDIMELSLTSRMDNQVLFSQTIISYPVDEDIGKLIPVSLIFPSKIDSNGLTHINYKPKNYEIIQKLNKTISNNFIIKSNITLISGIEKDHYTAHFIFYDKKEEIDKDKGSMAYLIFYNNNTSKILYLSTTEGMVEKKKIEGGYLVPVVYYVRVDPKKNSYFDEFYYQLQNLYDKFSNYLNSYTFPMIGINIIPRYDDVIIRSRRLQLVSFVKKDKIFDWKESLNDNSEIKLIENKNSKYFNNRVLLNRYSETINGYDELFTLGIKTNDIKFNTICKEEWIEDGICDFFCENDIKDCENIIEKAENSELQDNDEKDKSIPNHIENHSIHVECNINNNNLCWKYSTCTKINNNKKSFCICNDGFRHQVIRMIDNITGKILFRHSCEDIDECSEHNRQLKTEEREQKEGDIYMGYNTNHAIYPSIERTKEVTSILNSPFSSIKKHIITPSGLKSPCHPLAVCLNKIGNYECKCKPGYYGDGKKLCMQENICKDKILIDNSNEIKHSLFKELLQGIGINNTLISNNNYCPIGLHCINKSLIDEYDDNSTKPYYCACKKGFKLSEKMMKCIDIDECKEKKNGKYIHSCGRDSICTNTFGSYICSCPLGWLGNGYICVPKKEMKDIAVQVQLNGLYEKFISLNYDNFLKLFKQSIIQILNIKKDEIEIPSITIDQDKTVINIIIHFKKIMNIKNIYKNSDNSKKIEIKQHINLEKAILFIEKLKNNTSEWYKSTYIGNNYGNMINPTTIKASIVYRENNDLISKFIINYLFEDIYLFINSSPYGKTIIILSLLTLLLWNTIIMISIAILIKNLQKYIKSKREKIKKNKKLKKNIELEIFN